MYRIGRTGRAGSTGGAISLVDNEEIKLLSAIERVIKRKIDRATAEGFVPSANPQHDDERREPRPGRSAPRREGGQGRPGPRSEARTGKPANGRPAARSGPRPDAARADGSRANPPRNGGDRAPAGARPARPAGNAPRRNDAPRAALFSAKSGSGER